MTTIQPGRIIGVVVFIVNALCAYFLLPNNIIIFGTDPVEQQRVAILIGAVVIVMNIIQNQLPRFQDSPQRASKPDPLQGEN